MPRVSVLLPAHNASATVAAALRSALDQGLRQLEVIVVDDASDDDTAAVVKDVAAGDPRVHLIRARRNRGAAAARNRAMEAARGDWLALLDADDGFAIGRLERLVALGEAQAADIVADNLSLLRADGRWQGNALPATDPVFAGPLGAAGFVTRNHFLSGGFKLGYLKPLFRRTFVLQHGLRQDEGLRIAEDFHFLLDALLAGGRCLVERQAGYAYRLRPGSLSRGLALTDLQKLAAANRSVLERPEALADREVVAALSQRQRSIERNIQLARFVAALKGRQMVEAGTIFAQHPELTPFLAFFGLQSLRKRLPGGRHLV